jgi:hypothetical protein
VLRQSRLTCLWALGKYRLCDNNAKETYIGGYIKDFHITGIAETTVITTKKLTMHKEDTKVTISV